jgi:hypothetical protein
VVGDLAELSAAESAALSLRLADVDLAEVTRAVLAARDGQLRAAGLQIHTELHEGVVVRGDADRLHQALGNLVANAARYCRPGDQVTARVGASDGQGVVEIADTGAGYPRRRPAPRLRPAVARPGQRRHRRLGHRPGGGPRAGHRPRRHGHRRLGTRGRRHLHHPPPPPVGIAWLGVRRAAIPRACGVRRSRRSPSR